MDTVLLSLSLSLSLSFLLLTLEQTFAFGVMDSVLPDTSDLIGCQDMMVAASSKFRTGYYGAVYEITIIMIDYFCTASIPLTSG